MSEEKLDIADILKTNAVDDKISCAKVFEIIRKHTFFPDIVGVAMNNQKIKITHCQLGLFGYPDGKKITIAESVSEALENKIYSFLTEDDKLPCIAAWDIASELKITKPDVTAACEKMGIKIGHCQLGAF
jgi:phage terminase large subunit-like protein